MKRLFAIIAMTLAPASALWAMCPVHGGGCMPGRGGASGALYLLTLALGYWLLRIAEKEEVRLLKLVGRAASWVILAGSLIGLLSAACSRACGPKKMHCPAPMQSSMAQAEPEEEPEAAAPAPEREKPKAAKKKKKRVPVE